MKNTEKKSLNRDARRYIWHPFTQMKDWEKEDPVIIERGRGIYLYDIEGNQYLDAVSSLWVNLHGHRKSALDNSVRTQLKKIAHSTLLGLTNIPAIQLAKKLVAIAPKGLVKVFYSDNGSTAVEIAIKMSLQYWQLKGKPKKARYLTLENDYHGDTIGSVSVGGIDFFHSRYKPLLFPVHKIGAPYCYRCFLGKTYPECKMACVDEVERVLEKHHEEIAAMVIEPLVQGVAGMIVWPQGYLSKLRKLCTRYNVLMIADEVMTGFGRTGRMFAVQHEKVLPDLMAVAKGISGGYLPLAATLTTQEIYNAFLGDYQDFKTFFHGHSYTGNQLGCAVALANLKVMEEEKVLLRLRSKIVQLRRWLSEIRNYPHVGDVRQLGFLAGIELVKDKKAKTPYPLPERVGFQVAAEAKKRGVLIRPLGDVIVIMPPLSISPKTLRQMMNILFNSIKAVT